MKVIQEIPETELFLIKSLTKLARQFQLKQILELIEPFMVYN
jgi:predicted transposase YdaD